MTRTVSRRHIIGLAMESWYGGRHDGQASFVNLAPKLQFGRDQNTCANCNKPHTSVPPPTRPVSLDDWPIRTEDSEQILGLNALIVDARGGGEHAIPRAVRMPSTDSDTIGRLKKEAVGEVSSESLLTGVASFLRLIGSEDMIKRVWSRPEFLLYCPHNFWMKQEEYRLCAGVRARPRDEEPDLVRLYISDGQYVMPPDGGGDIVKVTWALGQRDFSYVLSYRRAIGVGPILHQREIAGKVTRKHAIQAVVNTLPTSLLDAAVPGYREEEGKWLMQAAAKATGPKPSREISKLRSPSPPREARSSAEEVSINKPYHGQPQAGDAGAGWEVKERTQPSRCWRILWLRFGQQQRIARMLRKAELASIEYRWITAAAPLNKRSPSASVKKTAAAKSATGSKRGRLSKSNASVAVAKKKRPRRSPRRTALVSNAAFKDKGTIVLQVPDVACPIPGPPAEFRVILPAKGSSRRKPGSSFRCWGNPLRHTCR
ncbi:hypothetical protein DL762_003106 [Monosporascus cannonballus]|uniref:START domain-containing protein n=1 Tax=Monosporascus cannonballus TaxID=155416 RepID=A0ABY0HEI5_9PEZI|nr:hypothetical protein DL762_003106 [Monosporascus cannonballus]